MFWKHIREKFPPARTVAFLTPIALPIIAAINTWVIDHAPWIDQYVDQTERIAIFTGTIAAGVGLAYKWLDGRAKWEAKQVDAYVGLALRGKSPDDVQGDVLEVAPPIPAPGPGEPSWRPDPAIDLDDDALLSQPDDIAESDIDPADEAERRQRIPAAE